MAIRKAFLCSEMVVFETLSKLLIRSWFSYFSMNSFTRLFLLNR